jgi:hypothetical protein
MIRWLRTPALAGLAVLAAFWAATLLAASATPGYSATDDVVSSLAAFGARWAVVGVLAIASFGVAYLAAAATVATSAGDGRSRGSAATFRRPAIGGLIVAGVATLVVSVSRLHCPDGAADCGVDPRRVAGLTDAMHGYAVVTSYLGALVSMVAVAALARLTQRRLLMWWAVVVAPLSLVSLLDWQGSSPITAGIGERIWLAVLTAWIASVCVGFGRRNVSATVMVDDGV